MVVMDSWPQPLPFIENINDRLFINKETQALLEAIDKPLVIVCIAGPYRTGKSYIMNRLAGKQIGFSLGSTVESHTKGIWVWRIEHPLDKTKDILLMDTEGLGDAMKGNQDSDMWILCLSVLLSSVFVYNIDRKIESGLTDQLAFVTQMSQYIRTRTAETNDVDFDQFFPMFLLVLRDFFLIPKINGRTITADEYMETMMLTMKPGQKKKDLEQNEIKKKIRSYFVSRKCFFFPRPTKQDEDLRNLETVSENKLEKNFIDASKFFCDFIVHQAPLKKVDHSQSVNGRILIHLAGLYVEAINKGTIPSIESTITAIKRSENTKALEHSVQCYCNRMKKHLKMPVTHERLIDVHQNCYKEAIALFLEEVFLDENQEYHQILQEKLIKEYNDFCLENKTTSTKKCNEILKDLFKTIDDNHYKKIYIRPGGFQLYHNGVEEIKSEYFKIPDKGPEEQEVWLETIKKRTSEKDMILKADESLSEAEKSLSVEQDKIQEAEKMAHLAKEAVEAAHLHEAALIKAHKEHVKMLQDSYSEQCKKQQENFAKILEDKEAEQKRLLDEGFEEEAKQLQSIIDNQKQQQKSTVSRVFGRVLGIAGNVMTVLPNPIAKGIGIAMSFLSNLF